MKKKKKNKEEEVDGIQENDQTAPSKIEEMTEEELLKKAIEYRDLSQRLAADYQNLQKQTEARISDIRKYSTEQLLLELAPLVDYFNSAFSTVPAEELESGWMMGIKHIQDQLLKTLQENNIEVIDAVGKTFDPEFHEAVGEEDSDEPADTILKNPQAGFTLNGRVVKPAKVIVAKTKEEKQEDNKANLKDN
ncbi:MAG: nucleotide exchange factor GrpE [bacterium]|nr:nucleotide exchange factor GrpE [bacterium]